MLLTASLSALAWVILSALVLWLGPLLTLGDARPLDSWAERLIACAVIGLLIALPLLVKLWRTRQAEKALRQGLTRAEEDAQAEAKQVQDLGNKAVQVLKQHLDGGPWYKPKAGLYSLPWYVFIGPPGSGKTTALMNSGLRFPLQTPMGQASVQGLGGTRHCDWWFTDQAVLIDTAGRFTTQDSDQSTDAAGWRSLLGLLKAHRPRQPVNGVLLTLSVTDIMAEGQAKALLISRIALRLQEMIKTLDQCPPVYVLITKMDMLPGFTDTFGALAERDRHAGWGINFDFPGSPSNALGQELPAAQQQWLSTLESQLNEQLGREAQESKRVKMLEFMGHFSDFLHPLKTVLTESLAGQSPFEKPLVLRGVYFTSGTQDGSVFDRILQQAQPVSPKLGTGVNGNGRSFFIQRLLSEVIFAEQHLAAYAKQRHRLERAARLGVWVVSLLAMPVLGGLWWMAYANESAMLERDAQRVTALADALSQPQQGLPELFTTLSSLQGLVEEDAQHRWAGGLSQREKLLAARDRAYQQGLQVNLMPRVALRLRQGLSQTMTQEPAVVQEALKAYLMLYKPEHLNVADLTRWVTEDWSRHVLPGLNGVDTPSALNHLRQALQSGRFDQLPAMDQTLVQQARNVIAQVPAEQRLFQRMVRLGPNDGQSEGWSVSRIVGPAHAPLFTRRSGKSNSETMPVAYTRQGYLGQFLATLPAEAGRFLDEETWVLDNQRDMNATASLSVLQRKTRELYARQYAQAWVALLADVELAAPRNFQGAVDLARILASAQSPLKILLQSISEQTRVGSALAAGAQGAADKVNTQAGRVLGSSAGNVAASLSNDLRPVEMLIDDQFGDLHRLFEGTPAGYEQVNTVLNDLYSQLAAVATAQQTKSAPPPAAGLAAVRVSAGVLPQAVRGAVDQLIEQAGEQSSAAERATLAMDLKPLQDVCFNTLSNRYPFQAGARADVLIDDFKRVFAPQGAMDQFFQSRLANWVDMGSNPWRFKPGMEGQGAKSGSLPQFQRAARIRDVFFAGGRTSPGFEFDMRLVQASPANDTFYLDNNGVLLMFSQQFDARHTVRWQPAGASGQVKFRASGLPETTLQGHWALFRLFDLATIQPGDRPEQFRAVFTLEGGRRFEFEVLATSAFNPLRLSELRQFRCPGSI